MQWTRGWVIREGYDPNNPNNPNNSNKALDAWLGAFLQLLPAASLYVCVCLRVSPC
jgi:hypothetical protein